MSRRITQRKFNELASKVTLTPDEKEKAIYLSLKLHPMEGWTRLSPEQQSRMRHLAQAALAAKEGTE